MPLIHAPQGRSVHCAIYARKSIKEGLDQENNSIEVQREICSAYVRSQRHRKWTENPQRYDDGGYSGGNLERPALRQLLADVENGHIDVIVIYKLDRLTRSLADFIRLIDLLEQYGVTFVSVTQAFDTQDSMGRLVLNILLTFAQFEREMLADRIRDKMAAMKRAGRWTGGAPPYGYDVVKAKLIVNPSEAAIVREIFERYLQVASSEKLTNEFRARGLKAKCWINRRGEQSGGGLATRGMIYAMLGSPVYIGQFHFKGEVFKGQHEAIIDRDLWDRVQVLRDSRKLKQPPARPQDHLLLGFSFDDIGRAMRIEGGTKRQSRYRYYISDSNHRATKHGIKQLRAGGTDLEELVQTSICALFRRRFDLSGAIHSSGLRDAATDRLIDRGPTAARHLESFDRRRLRLAWEALIDRVELSREWIRIVLRCDQMAALLAWPGTGLFRSRGVPTAEPHRTYALQVEAVAVRSERRFRLPLDPKSTPTKPQKGLVSLMRFARKAQETVYENRALSIEEVATRLGRRPAFVARALRLNYLAPDIIAAIMDGAQPKDLTRKALMFSSIPMDWAQQRALFGFPARCDPSANDQYY